MVRVGNQVEIWADSRVPIKRGSTGGDKRHRLESLPMRAPEHPREAERLAAVDEIGLVGGLPDELQQADRGGESG